MSAAVVAERIVRRSVGRVAPRPTPGPGVGQLVEQCQAGTSRHDVPFELLAGDSAPGTRMDSQDVIGEAQRAFAIMFNALAGRDCVSMARAKRDRLCAGGVGEVIS